MKFFTGIHDIQARDKTRDWSLSEVKTDLFDAKKQPVPSYQNPWELAQLLEIFVDLEAESYLELGPYHGGTLYWFIQNAFEHCENKPKYGAVDFFDELLGERWVTPTEWDKWAAEQAVDFKFFEGDTHDPEIVKAVKEYFTRGIDFLLIDATHDYEHCRQDLDDYAPFVNEGGIIALHDVRPSNLGSSKLWEEIRQAGYVTQLLVADPYSDSVDAGIGVIFV